MGLVLLDVVLVQAARVAATTLPTRTSPARTITAFMLQPFVGSASGERTCGRRWIEWTAKEKSLQRRNSEHQGPVATAMYVQLILSK